MGVFTFQVTELVKVAMVVFLAHLLTRKVHHLKKFSRGVAVPLSVTAVIMGLIIFQPDFGTVVIIASILLLMLSLAGTRITHLLFLGAAFIPVGIWLILHKSYRLARLRAFLDPWKDPDKTGFQLIQSLISFGSGGVFGQGLGDGMQKLFYLPEPPYGFYSGGHRGRERLCRRDDRHRPVHRFSAARLHDRVSRAGSFRDASGRRADDA
jgi:cell division protein FtsW